MVPTDMDKRILPALKSGIALWSDGNNERRHVSASSSGSDVRPTEGTIAPFSRSEKGNTESRPKRTSAKNGKSRMVGSELDEF